MLERGKEIQIKTRHLWLWILSITVLVMLNAVMALVCQAQSYHAGLLTQQEREWLDVHPVITLGPDPFFPPIEFLDEDGIYRGIAADYIALVEKNLGIKFKIVRLEHWDEVVKQTQNRQIDVWGAATRSPQRSRYMLFTSPHIELPGVIISRQGGREKLTMEQLKDMRVAVVSSYIWQDFIENDYPDMKLELVPDIQTGLKEVSFGTVDAFINDLATTSYYIEQEGITNLRVVGETGYFTRLAFASRSDWPELNSILEKGLAQISQTEIQSIFTKWVHLKGESLFDKREFWISLFVGLGLIVTIIICIIVWNRSLKKQVGLRTEDLKKELAERKKTEVALRESEEKSLLLLNSTGEAIYGLDMEGNCTFCNPSCLSLLGYEDESQLLGQNMHDLIHHTRKDGTPYPVEECCIYKAFREGKGIHVDDEVFWRADGTSFASEYRSFPVFREGETVGSVVSFVDITERRMAVDQIKALNETLELRVRERTSEINKLYHAIEQSSCTIVITDIEGNIEYVNPKFTQITGYTSEEAIGKNPRILKSGNQGPEVYKELWDTITSGGEWHGEFYNKKKNGEFYWELASISPIKNEKGVITNFIAAKEDITARKEVESKLKTVSEEALRANKAKSVFLSSMSHELRTPLNSILGFAQLLDSDSDAPLSESQKEAAAYILKSGNHLLELINEVLDLSGVESGKVQISSEDIEIDTAINDAITTVGSMAEESSITINYRTKSDEQYIRADYTRLNQVLINLLSNAIKYNNDGGSVSIWIEFPADDMLRVNIEDTGPGIAKENHGSLFEPFNRLGAESLNIEGTGVGLTITKRLVELMGGSIGVESEVGKGTKFYVDFIKAGSPVPVTGKKEEVETEKYDVDITERYTMLYVEDNPANLELVESILQRRPGISLLTAPEAQPGIELAKLHKPDIILMDINLPGMDGYEALTLLKSFDQTKEIPIIALSANAMPKDIEKGIASGFVEYITKPINVNKFLKLIDTILMRQNYDS